MSLLSSTGSSKQVELCLFKVKTSSLPRQPSPSRCKHCVTTRTPSRPSLPLTPITCFSTPSDLLDLLNEDPLTYQRHKDSPSQFNVQSSRDSSGKNRQTNLLSFLDSSATSTSTVCEHTPLSKCLDTPLRPSRALFPTTPTRSGSSVQRKRKLSNENEDKQPKKRKPSKRKKKENLEQLQLDCGQKLLGHVTCKVCGMVYTLGRFDDEEEHSRFHTRFVRSIYFPGWKKERVVTILEFGRIVLVLPTDSKQHLKKVEDIQCLVDQELGFSVSTDQPKRQFKVFLCVSERKKLMGCVFTEQITQGYEVLSDGSTTFDNLSAWFCSTEPQPAVVGINRLWVSGSCRRMGVASKLLDAVRSNFIPGVVVSKDKLAFTDPTPDGKLFASRYCGQTNFLVYR